MRAADSPFDDASPFTGAPFERIGPAIPASPVILSVPHAGCDYPPALVAALRMPVAAVRGLEDRHVDLVARAARGEETLFVARRPRAWIDLNRSEAERDPRIDDGATLPVWQHSIKLRSGLGLVPRRVMAGDIWRRRLSDAEVVARIRADYRPYHAALAQALTAARDRFGIALLLDVHSMPPLGHASYTPRIVLGDRKGAAAAARLTERLGAVIQRALVPFAVNDPYAGGHILAQHAAPEQGIHAIQVEFDRRLYLDRKLEEAGPGLADTAALLRRMIDAVQGELLPVSLAAE